MTASAWTDDRIGRLKTLWLEGRSADWIARDLACGISRNAVLGKVHRMGLSAGRTTTTPKPPAAAAPAPEPQRRPRPLPRPPSVAATPDQGGVALLSVRRWECRWPSGDPLQPDFSLCGRAVSRGAYCADHAGIAYRPAPAGPDNLDRLARLD
jgi:GcrA cell cycle regulator